MSSCPTLRGLGAWAFLACASSAAARQSPETAGTLHFDEVGGDARIEVFALEEAQLRFRWLAPLPGDRTGCASEGEASAIAPPLADPEIEDGPDGEVFAGREYWHAADTDCMLSIVVELEATRLLLVTRLSCEAGTGCDDTAGALFMRKDFAARDQKAGRTLTVPTNLVQTRTKPAAEPGRCDL